MKVRANGRPQRPVALPVVGGGGGDHALHRSRAVVAGAARGVAVVAARRGHRQPVRVEEDLLRIESQAAFRRERTVRPVGVNLAGLQTGDQHVPVVIGTVLPRVEPNDARGRRRLHVVEEQQFESRRALREDAEVDPHGRDRRAERGARAGPMLPRRHSAPRPVATGLTCQMSRQYSRIERSDEKRPTRAQLRIDMRVQSS